MTPTQKLVLARIADRINDTTGVCWPSVPGIAADTCLAESSVRNAISELRKLGELLVEPGGGRGRPNVYRLPINPPAAGAIENPPPAVGNPPAKPTSSRWGTRRKPQRTGMGASLEYGTRNPLELRRAADVIRELREELQEEEEAL